MTHSCAAKGCNKQVPLKMLMCKKHWFMVPKPMRDTIWAEYSPGQENDMSGLGNEAYMQAVKAAVDYLADQEPQKELF
jgi:hypothetical protein